MVRGHHLEIQQECRGLQVQVHNICTSDVQGHKMRGGCVDLRRRRPQQKASLSTTAPLTAPPHRQHRTLPDGCQHILHVLHPRAPLRTGNTGLLRAKSRPARFPSSRNVSEAYIPLTRGYTCTHHILPIKTRTFRRPAIILTGRTLHFFLPAVKSEHIDNHRSSLPSVALQTFNHGRCACA